MILLFQDQYQKPIPYPRLNWSLRLSLLVCKIVNNFNFDLESNRFKSIIFIMNLKERP